MVVTAIPQPACGFIRNLEIAAAEQARDRPVVDALELDDQTWLAGAAPLHLALTPVEDECRSSLETLGEVCQGINLHSAIEPILTEHLAAADHEPEPPPSPRASRRH